MIGWSQGGSSPGWVVCVVLIYEWWTAVGGSLLVMDDIGPAVTEEG